MTEKDQAEHDEEYQELLALYETLLNSMNTDGEKEALYTLSEKRTDIAFKYLTKGFNISVDWGLHLLQLSDGLTEDEQKMKERVEAGINNLIDFSVCEEYQLYKEVDNLIGDSEIDIDVEDYAELIALCKKYNDTYSAIENADISYSGVIAAWWIKRASNEYLVYWTQNDARVRPWHMALQGYAAHPDEFPSWMIPPIEYHCRCFLTGLDLSEASANLHNIKNVTKEFEKPSQLSDVYSESLAKCGRIFGPSHSYFTVMEDDTEMLHDFVGRLKEKYYGKKI